MNDGAVALSYKHCQEITRRQARNFYYGIRLLPPRKRAAMCALYAMARRIDDVGDGQGAPSEDRLAALEDVRESLVRLEKLVAEDAMSSLPASDPVLTALGDAARQFPISFPTLMELVEGCEWDVAGRTYKSFDDLVEYCRRVAGTIGRLSLDIYGTADPEGARPLADALGVALQLTNILRDVVEDRDVMGRTYLPGQDLERFGVAPDLQGEPDDVMALICFESGRASEWYERGLPLLGMLDRRSRACTAAMAGIYRNLLDKIRARPDSVLKGRVSLSAKEKTTVAAMALARALA